LSGLTARTKQETRTRNDDATNPACRNKTTIRCLLCCLCLLGGSVRFGGMAASSYREVQNQSKANKQNEEKRLDFAPEKTKTGVKINQSTHR